MTEEEALEANTLKRNPEADSGAKTAPKAESNAETAPADSGETNTVDGSSEGKLEPETNAEGYKKYMRYFKKPSESSGAEKHQEMPGFKVRKSKDPVKVLISGDVRGKFRKLFATAKLFQDRVGPFSAMFCVGDFFSRDGTYSELKPFLEGQQRIPVPTYFICGEERGEATDLLRVKEEASESKTPAPLRLCENLHFLGRQGRMDICGLSVGYLSGRFHPEHFLKPPDKTEHLKAYNSWYCDDHLDDLLDNTGGGTEEETPDLKNGIDVLLTSEWPQFDLSFELPELPEHLANPSSRETIGSPAVGALVGGIATRYHFAGSHNIYYSLPPFRNKRHNTRFYALAGIGNAAKQKSLKAFSVIPVASMSSPELEVMQKEASPNPFETEATNQEDAEKNKTQKMVTVDKGEAQKNTYVFHDGICKSHEVYDDGRWKCAYCGNVNYARQNKHCNMRKCQAPAPPCIRPVEKVEHHSEKEEKKVKRAKKDSIYAAQRPKKRRGPKNE
eukprot:CAMPEP_0184502348 /NCGR_PEP_ID=MMETSP0113_2-20130426/50082_1 /TAXON_ID=91329 /ORGANISM="Norrisiella sphaerica, Strain BC52" /LENGTH=501 /DNA_ID=CAMNT_0026891477 /DNA_START=174 /DNA_END=1679 /DNA_ORIENTATION=+